MTKIKRDAAPPREREEPSLDIPDDEPPARAPRKTKSQEAVEAISTTGKRRLRAVEPDDGDLAELLRDDMRKDYNKDVVVDPDDPAVEVNEWVFVGEPFSGLTDVPGIPIGHVTVFDGLQDCGKTTSLMAVLIEAQKQGVATALIETERKFSLKRFERMGGDRRKLIVIPVDTLEEGFDKLHNLITKIKERLPKKKVLIGWDSLGLTPTNAELLEKEGIMSASRVIKNKLRITVARLKRTNVGLLFVNHIYKKPGVMFGEGTSGYGGSGAYFAAVLVFQFKYIGTGTKKRDGKMVFDHVKAQIRVKKNHVSDAQARRADVRIGPEGIVLDTAEKKKKRHAGLDESGFDESPEGTEGKDFAEADDL